RRRAWGGATTSERAGTSWPPSRRPLQLVETLAQAQRARVRALVVLAVAEQLERRRAAEPRLEGAVLHRAVRHVARAEAQRGGIDHGLAAVIEDRVQPIAPALDAGDDPRHVVDGDRDADPRLDEVAPGVAAEGGAQVGQHAVVGDLDVV